MDQTPPLRNDEPWGFCGKCGAPMEWAPRGQGFSRATGKRVDIYVWSCPEWKHNSADHDRASHTITQRLKAPKADSN